MPTFTTITLERLLEPGSQNSVSKPPQPKEEKKMPPIKKKVMRTFISPALYATPEKTPIPDSPSSFPPSPYIINHKRRGPSLARSSSQMDEIHIVDKDKSHAEDENRTAVANGQEAGPSTLHERTAETSFEAMVSSQYMQATMSTSGCEHQEVNGVDDSVHVLDTPKRSMAADAKREADGDDFLDPNDSVSVASYTELDDSGFDSAWKNMQSAVDYFDANEELSTDGFSTPIADFSRRAAEKELRAMRTSLLMEIERRKQAEEAIENLKNQWQRLAQEMSLVGISLPMKTPSIGCDELPDDDFAEDIHLQVTVIRLVADAIGRGSARAEVEPGIESEIESKNFEISRLKDRIHYYETMNHEMSQRNQEVVDMARKQRQRQKARQRWIWGSIGLAISLGASALAWTYLPSVSNHWKPASDDISKDVTDIPGDA